MIKSFIVVFVIVGSVSSKLFREKADTENWTGRWFPDKPTDVPSHAHRIPMGILNSNCDDAKTDLEVDWDGDPAEYTCYDQRFKYIPDFTRRPIEEIQSIPKSYKADHQCMNVSIKYNDVIPTFGTHRPLWAKWGEYKYLPVQRWLHNMEHGGLVMLYHPCTPRKEVNRLRKLVTGCLYRHIISPYNRLSPERPLALVAWGKSLQMSGVSDKVVTQFIKEAALRGPEHIYRDGQYSYLLLEHSQFVTDEADTTLCPNYRKK